MNREFAGDETAQRAAAEFLAKATATDMNSAVRAAARRKPSPGRFGWRWFLGALRDRLATEAREAEANAQAEERRTREAQERRQHEAEAAAIRDHFVNLSDSAKAEYRRRAVETPGPFRPRTADQIDHEAARLAWQDRSKQENVRTTW
jgi:hypothetical protein